MSIQLKRSLAADLDRDYVLKAGQIGIEMPLSINSRSKPFLPRIGDGTSKYSDLPIIGDFKIWTPITEFGVNPNSGDVDSILRDLPLGVSGIAFPAGSYLAGAPGSGTLEINVPCYFAPGATLSSGGGLIKFNKPVIAGRYWIFYPDTFVSYADTPVFFKLSDNDYVYPEWFGWKPGTTYNYPKTVLSQDAIIYFDKGTYSTDWSSKASLQNVNTVFLKGQSRNATTLMLNGGIDCTELNATDISFNDCQLASNTLESINVSNCTISQSTGQFIVSESAIEHIHIADSTLDLTTDNYTIQTKQLTTHGHEIIERCNFNNLAHYAVVGYQYDQYNSFGTIDWVDCYGSLNGKLMLTSMPYSEASYHISRLTRCNFKNVGQPEDNTAGLTCTIAENCVFELYQNQIATGPTFVDTTIKYVANQTGGVSIMASLYRCKIWNLSPNLTIHCSTNTCIDCSKSGNVTISTSNTTPPTNVVRSNFDGLSRSNMQLMQFTDDYGWPISKLSGTTTYVKFCNAATGNYLTYLPKDLSASNFICTANGAPITVSKIETTSQSGVYKLTLASAPPANCIISLAIKGSYNYGILPTITNS